MIILPLFILEIFMKIVFLGVAFIISIIASNIWGYPHSINFTFISVLLYLISTVILFIILKSIEYDKIFIYPLFGFLLVLCFMPILNYLALSFSYQYLHEVKGAFGQETMEMSATEVTVFWGKWYAQAFYSLVGAGIGYLFAKED